MKKSLTCILFIQVVLLFVFLPSAHSQIGQFYTWQDTLHVTTSSIDTVWATPWTSVTLWAATVDCYMVFGAPYTSGWSSRIPTKIDAGSALVFGPATKLKRLKVWTRSGEGALYLLGYKSERQY